MKEPIGDTSDHDSYRPMKAEIAAFYKSREWLELAYETKLAYGRQCQCCGAKAADGIRIITDHIRPVRYYWHLRLTPTNLQVLCTDCNLAKGSWDQTDFRPEPCATEPVMAFLREQIGLANLRTGEASAKELITDAYSHGEISEAQGAELVRHFGLVEA